MIKEIRINNLYSFNQETITLHPEVSILIGINGSGKSNFFKAVRLLREGVAGMGLRAYIFDVLGGFDNILFKGVPANNVIEIEYILSGSVIAAYNIGFSFQQDISYKITITKSPGLQNYYVKERIETIVPDKTGFIYLSIDNGSGVLHEHDRDSKKTKLVTYTDFNPLELALMEVTDTNRYLALTTIRKAIRNIALYENFDTTYSSPIRKPMLPTSEKRLLPDGKNLPQILNTIKINHKQRYYAHIVAMLQEVNPMFHGFDFNHIGGNIELLLDEKHLDSSVHVSSISDGTLRYLCLLAILYNPERGNFICIDEPEVGLHPDMIRNIAKAINEISKECCIIISTHSTQLLDNFDIENIRVFEKNDNNATKVISFKESQFEGWYENYSTGKMWMEGDFGGVRYGG